MKFTLLIYFTLFCSMIAFSQSERKYIREGNEYYKKAMADTSKVDTAKFNKAEIAYRKSLEKNYNSFEGSFNLGNALYKEKKYNDAANQYKVLAHREKESSDDKLKTSKIYHNLGNSLLQAGKIDEAIDAYKTALRKYPKDKDTKYNLAVAQKMKKEGKNQQNQQNQDQKQDQQKQDQQKQQQQQQDQQKQDNQQQQQQQGKEQKISKEDAERILQSMQNDEKQVLEKVKKEKVANQRTRADKEW